MHSVKIPVGFGKAETSKGRPVSMMAHLKRSMVEVKAKKLSGARTNDYCSLSEERSKLPGLQKGVKEDLAKGPRVAAGVGRRSQQRRWNPRTTGYPAPSITV